MILREDLFLHCKECVNNPLGNISIAHQIACCTFDDCLLHDKRPILVTDISPLMMEYFQVSTDLLCERARRVAEPALSRSVEDEIEFLLDEIIETNMIVFVTDGEP